MKLLLSFATVCLVLAAGGARAQIQDSARWKHWDFSLQTRYIGAHDVEGERGSSVDFSDDLGWGFGCGYHANEHFSFGVLISWRSVSYQAQLVRDDAPDQLLRYNNGLDAGSFSLSGEWYPLGKTLTPYVSGSAGWTMLDTNVATGDTDGYCWWDPWYGYICDTYEQTYETDAASFGLGAGVRCDVSGKVFFRAGYEHSWIDLDNVDGLDMLRVDAGVIY